MAGRDDLTKVARCALCALALWGSPLPATAQLEVGDVVFKETLLRRLGPDSLFDEPRELVRASTGWLSVMTPRLQDGQVRGGVVERRETFVSLHARRGMGSEDAFDRGVAAVRVDDRFRVLLIAETELGFVERLETIEPPTDGSSVGLLHVRYAQTGSGGVTEDLLYALDAGGDLVDVPIEEPDLSSLLQQGEYLCCSRFTSFDEDLVEQTVYVTRDGRRGISDRVRVRYGLEGRYRLDEAAKAYVPDFRLAVRTASAREPVR